MYFLPLFAIVLSATSASATSNWLLRNVKTLATSANPPKSQTIRIPIDHFGNLNTNFTNRYWYNDKYYQSGGPIFLMDVGEADARNYVPFLEERTDVTSAVMELARQYKGIALLWEHRYYGGSAPFSISTRSLGKDQWGYNTVDQALEDVVYFTTQFSTSNVTNEQLKPSNTPWIFLGGSYPGMRAALLRVRNPDVIFASWASSAPVEAQIDMSAYWRTVQNAIPRNCSTDLVEMASFVDGAFRGSNTTLAESVKLQIVRAHLGGSLSGVTQSAIDAVDYATVAAFLLDILSGWQDQGLILAHEVCDYLETVGRQVSPSDNGIVARYGIGPFFDAWISAVSTLQKQLLRSASIQSGDDPIVFTLKDTPPPTTDVLSAAVMFGDGTQAANTADYDFDMLPWLHSVCTEFGFFQVTDHGQRSMVSSFVTLESKQDMCKEVFNNIKGLIPSKVEPKVDHVNKYGGWGMNPSRVFFTAGELDPWTTLSVASQEDNSPKRTASSVVPAYNQGGANGSYFGIVYPKTVHATDLAVFKSSDDPSRRAAYQQGYALFTQALDEWLPNFKAAQTEDATNAGKNKFNDNSTARITPWSALMIIIALTSVLLA